MFLLPLYAGFVFGPEIAQIGGPDKNVFT